MRLKNAARPGGYVETVEALVNHPAYQTPLGPNQGCGVALRLLVQRRRRIERQRSSQRGRHRHHRDRHPTSAARAPRWH